MSTLQPHGHLNPTKRNDFQIVAYVDAACLALLIYDTLLTLAQEYQFVWRTKKGIINALYLFTRYSTFATSVLAAAKHLTWDKDPAVCRAAIKATTMLTSAAIGQTEVILIIRTYALWGRPRGLLVFFVMMWMCIGGLNIWGMIKWSESVKTDPFTFCNLESSSDIILVCYISRLVGETLLAALMCWKLWPMSSRHRSHFVASFYRDGIFWYLAMVAVLCFNVVFQIAARPSLKLLGDGPMRVLHALLACRLVLHVRVVADKDPRFSFRVEDSTAI